MNLIAEAIEILTDDGTGLPVAYSNTAIGLDTDGHFYLVTDRPTITTMTGDTTRTTWYPRILTRNYGNWTLSRNIDFVEAGAMESVSDFQVGILNIADFRNTLQANGVYLGRRRVKYYRFTSTNGTDWTSELRWTGVVDDQPFNELTYSLKCVNTSKDVFGSLPTVPANSQDKMIPIALGRVAYSPMVNVSGSGAKTVLNMMGDYDYSIRWVKAGSNLTYVAACLGYYAKGDSSGPPADGPSTIARLEIATLGKTFQIDELKGKYVNIIAGGNKQTVLIIGNGKTYTLDPSTTYLYSPNVSITPLQLAENLDVSTPFQIYFYTLPDTNYWYCEVVDYSATLIASSKPIYQFNRGSTATIAFSRYLSDGNLFDSIAEAARLSSLSNIQSTGFPGIFSASDTADNGSLTFYSSVVPVQIHFAGASSPGFAGFPAVGTLMPLLNNQNLADFYTVTIPAAYSCYFSLDLQFPQQSILKQFDALYALFDLSHKIAISTYVVCTATIYGIDYIGRITSHVVNYDFKASNLGSSFVDLFRLPGSYYNVVRDDTAFHVDKDNFDIKSLIGDTKAMTAYNRVRIQFTIQSGDVLYTLNLREVGFVGKRSISFTSETPYAGLIGETFGSTWEGRKTPTDPILTVCDGLEGLVRTYDETAAFWQASYPYVIGDKVRSVADNGHVFVCTAAGTSAGAEPAWTTTAGATYTDGGVTWQEHHRIAIDTGAFDTTAYYRANWNIGRTLTEKKTSVEYYQSLLEQAFLLGVFTPDGRLQIKSWLDHKTPLVAFDETNILVGTLGDVTTTPVRRMYNDLLLKYDKNPASGTYNKQIAVTKIDQPAFPGPFDTVVTGTSLGAFSATYEYLAIGTGLYVVTFETTLAHGLSSGDFVSLSGNGDGYDFAPTEANVIDSTHFGVILNSGGFTASPTTSGTLVKNPVSRLKWQDYVSGILNYATAESLWMQCHNSFLVTMAVNKLPDNLGQCEFYFDAYAKDENGKFIWSDDGGNNVSPALDMGDAHAAAFLANAFANWTAWQKKQVPFEAADTPTTSGLNLGDCVSFADQKLTAGSSLIGWIHEKTQLPRDEKKPGRFRFGLTLYPEALNTYTGPNIIEEHGATDVIDEHTATDIIEEHGA